MKTATKKIGNLTVEMSGSKDHTWSAIDGPAAELSALEAELVRAGWTVQRYDDEPTTMYAQKAGEL